MSCFCKLSVRKETMQRVRGDVVNIFRKRNPDLSHIKTTDDFLVNWLIDRYINNRDLK